MKKRETRRAGSRGAFTLIEFLVVMTIIGVLAALIVPRFFGRIGQAKQAVARQKISVLETKVLEFNADCQRYPTASEGLQALLRQPQSCEQWNGPYVKDKDILDPWGAEFRYVYPGRFNRDFDLYTLGADGQEGGEEDNEDLGNWM